MLSVTNLLMLVTAIALVVNILLPLGLNIRRAKRSGLQYVVVPFNAYNTLVSIFMSRTFLKLADKILAEPSVISWRRLVTASWPWKLKHAPFLALGVDTFLTVSPGGCILHTADADVISQITSRGDDFPKATALYKHVDIYGTNVVSSGGAIWRRHRAITAPVFTEKNNRLVWKETIDVTQSLLSSWIRRGDGTTVSSLASDSMRLSLEVIGRAGLGQKLEWPRATDDQEIEEASLLHGHTMTFTAALQSLLVHVFWIIAVPKWLLNKNMTKALARANTAYVEWGQYLTEVLATKRAEAMNGLGAGDLMEQLLKAQDQSKDAKSEHPPFSDSEVKGNLFMFIIAGHETSGNSIHFCLIFLAMYPKAQRMMQKSIETIFKGRPVLDWNYDQDLPRLLNSYVAAVLNEQLRLIAPAINIPKIVSSEDQHLTVDGQQVTIPANSMARLCISSVHRNPKFWPLQSDQQSSKASLTTPHNDLEEFKPERWISESDGSLLTPVKGSYIPFSDGQRACLGRRFAQVEILVALAVIFSHHSVELAVDEWASDEEFEGMNTGEKKIVWQKARDKADWILQNKTSAILTLQIRGAQVPVRFVNKTEERFRGIVSMVCIGLRKMW